MQETNQQSPLAILTTPESLTKKYPETFKKGGVRSWIFNEELNGLKQSGAIIRVGRKIYLDETKLFQWLSQQSKGV